MKQTTLLNQALSAVIAGMGHGDLLVIGDYGLPCPKGVQRVDLALRPGTPTFQETLETVLTELRVEQAIFAGETGAVSPRVLDEALEALGGIPVVNVTHAELKELSARAVAVVRTGECTPYANVILKAGVTF